MKKISLFFLLPLLIIPSKVNSNFVDFSSPSKSISYEETHPLLALGWTTASRWGAGKLIEQTPNGIDWTLKQFEVDPDVRKSVKTITQGAVDLFGKKPKKWLAKQIDVNGKKVAVFLKKKFEEVVNQKGRGPFNDFEVESTENGFELYIFHEDKNVVREIQEAIRILNYQKRLSLNVSDKIGYKRLSAATVNKIITNRNEVISSSAPPCIPCGGISYYSNEVYESYYPTTSVVVDAFSSGNLNWNACSHVRYSMNYGILNLSYVGYNVDNIWHEIYKNVYINQNTNYEFKAKVKFNDNKSHNTAAIKFAATEYSFSINKSGYFSFSHSDILPNNRNWEYSSSININEYNELKLIHINGVWYFFINNVFVKSVYKVNSQFRNAIGIAYLGNIKVDYISLSELSSI